MFEEKFIDPLSFLDGFFSTYRATTLEDGRNVRYEKIRKRETLLISDLGDVNFLPDGGIKIKGSNDIKTFNKNGDLIEFSNLNTEPAWNPPKYSFSPTMADFYKYSDYKQLKNGCIKRNCLYFDTNSTTSPYIYSHAALTQGKFCCSGSLIETTQILNSKGNIIAEYGVVKSCGNDDIPLDTQIIKFWDQKNEFLGTKPIYIELDFDGKIASPNPMKITLLDGTEIETKEQRNGVFVSDESVIEILENKYKE